MLCCIKFIRGGSAPGLTVTPPAPPTHPPTHLAWFWARLSLKSCTVKVSGLVPSSIALRHTTAGAAAAAAAQGAVQRESERVRHHRRAHALHSTELLLSWGQARSQRQADGCSLTAPLSNPPRPPRSCSPPTPQQLHRQLHWLPAAHHAVLDCVQLLQRLHILVSAATVAGGRQAVRETLPWAVTEPPARRRRRQRRRASPQRCSSANRSWGSPCI